MRTKNIFLVLFSFCMGCSGGHSKKYDDIILSADSITVSWNRFSDKVYLSKDEIDSFKKYAIQKDIKEDNQSKFTPEETVELYSHGIKTSFFTISSTTVNFNSESLNFGFRMPYRMGMFIDGVKASGAINKAREVRLGNSDYFIDLPTQFRITEAKGKEGQLGYGIEPLDSAASMFGFIEIVHGLPESIPLHPDTAELYKSALLDQKPVQWKLYQTETGYFIAFTAEKGVPNAHASAKQQTGIDSLIAIISTLRKK